MTYSSEVELRIQRLRPWTEMVEAKNHDTTFRNYCRKFSVVFKGKSVQDIAFC